MYYVVNEVENIDIIKRFYNLSVFKEKICLSFYIIWKLIEQQHKTKRWIVKLLCEYYNYNLPNTLVEHLYIRRLKSNEKFTFIHNSWERVSNFLMFKKTWFVEKLKLVSKWTNILDSRAYFNYKDDHESNYLQENPVRGGQRKLILNHSKQRFLKSQF